MYHEPMPVNYKKASKLLRSSLAISGSFNPVEKRYADRLEELVFCIFDYEKKARGVDFLDEEC